MSDTEEHTEIPQEHDNYNGWSKRKQHLVRGWIDTLTFNQIVSYFYVFLLKKIENKWAWMIIVLSAITSTISLVQFEDENYKHLNIVVKILITVFSLLITLIASWMKKQNYVERIGTVDKYLQKLNKLIAELEGQIQIDPASRLIYSQFLEKYKDQLIEYVSSCPDIDPWTWKKTMYILTKYYPELTMDIEPWKSDPLWSANILNTYHKLKYRKISSRITNCYYCMCKCFGSNKEIVIPNHHYGRETDTLFEEEPVREPTQEPVPEPGLVTVV